MKACKDESEFEWIKRGRKPPALRKSNLSEWSGIAVRNLIPDIFPAYAKIFHRLEANYSYMDNPLSPEEEELLSIPKCGALRALIQRLRTGEEHVRIWWKDVAHMLDLPFVQEISDEWFRERLEQGCWPRYIHGPGGGYLEPEEYSELVSALSQGNADLDCFFRLPEMRFLAVDQPLLFQGTIENVTRIPAKGNWNTPEYWWPSLREWCVCSDYEHPVTLLGGPDELISRVLSSKLIEAIEVTADARMDYFSPIPERPLDPGRARPTRAPIN